MSQAMKLAKELRAYIQEDEGDLGCVADAAEMLVTMSRAITRFLKAWSDDDGGSITQKRLISAVENLEQFAENY